MATNRLAGPSVVVTRCYYKRNCVVTSHLGIIPPLPLVAAAVLLQRRPCRTPSLKCHRERSRGEWVLRRGLQQVPGSVPFPLAYLHRLGSRRSPHHHAANQPGGIYEYSPSTLSTPSRCTCSIIPMHPVAPRQTLSGQGGLFTDHLVPAVSQQFPCGRHRMHPCRGIYG